MNHDSAIHVVGLGASTPVGRDAWASAAAVRAGIAGFSQHPFLMDTAGEPIRIAAAQWLDAGTPMQERLAALLLPAIGQCLQPLEDALSGLRMPLALGIGTERPGFDAPIRDALIEQTRNRHAGTFSAFAAFPNGHAAGLLALEVVCRKLGEGALDACLIACVDSYLSPETLEWLETCDQLHGAGPQNNAWGFIPGEAAGALLLMRADTAARVSATAFAQVVAVGRAVESKRIKTETVCIGEGLTEAFRGALAPLSPEEKVTDIYCDMNGEPYRADEYGFTCLRTREHFESASDFVAPADCWGDVGAAGMPLHVALASIAGAKGYANGPTAFVWASSEDGNRGAASLRVSEGHFSAG